MSFETGARQIFLARISGGRSDEFGWIGQLELALCQFEKVENAQVFEQLSNARIGIEQFEVRTATVVRAGDHFQAESCEDAQKSAIHECAFGEVEHEIIVAFIAQFSDQRFEIDAGGEIGPSSNSDTGEFLAHQHTHPGRLPAHAFDPTICTKVCCNTSASSRPLETSR